MSHWGTEKYVVTDYFVINRILATRVICAARTSEALGTQAQLATCMAIIDREMAEVDRSAYTLLLDLRDQPEADAPDLAPAYDEARARIAAGFERVAVVSLRAADREKPVSPKARVFLDYGMALGWAKGQVRL